VVAARKLPALVAGIAVPIVAAFYVGGPGFGVAVGALTAVAIVLLAARARLRARFRRLALSDRATR
jgi:hypothetical protein